MTNTLAQALDRRIREILRAAHERVAALAEAFKAETGIGHPLITNGRSATAANKPPKRTQGTTKKRQRRSPEQLRKDALGVVELIKAKGKEGLDGKSIRARIPKIGQSITDFVSKHGKVKLQSKGKGTATRYFVS